MKRWHVVPAESSVAFPDRCRSCLTGSAWICSAESSAGSCTRPPPGEPPGTETPRRPAPGTGWPLWRWRVGWSSAWLHLQSVLTQPASSLDPPQLWQGFDPSCCSWNISNHKKNKAHPEGFIPSVKLTRALQHCWAKKTTNMIRTCRPALDRCLHVWGSFKTCHEYTGRCKTQQLSSPVRALYLPGPPSFPVSLGTSSDERVPGSVTAGEPVPLRF